MILLDLEAGILLDSKACATPLVVRKPCIRPLGGPSETSLVDLDRRLLRCATITLVKGDRVEVVIDTGEGTRTFDIAATKAGRRVEVSSSRGVLEVSEVTRTGEAVRTGRFMATRVVAVVEHPAQDEQKARAAKQRNQPSLL